MRYKKTILFVVAIIILLIVCSVVFYINKDRKIDGLLKYDKYKTYITVNLLKDKKRRDELITVYDDGISSSIESNRVKYESYINKNKLYYIDNDKLFIKKLEDSYRNLYESILKSLDIREIDDIQNGRILDSKIDYKNANELFKMMFLKIKIDKDIPVKVTLNEKRIDEFSLEIDDLKDYDKVLINIKFIELDDSFKIDTSRISGNGNIVSFNYKSVETEINPYEIEAINAQ